MKIALIGIGSMGLPIARRLAAAPGLELAVFDVESDRLDALDVPARRATSVADAASGADAVFTVLPADRHVEAVAGELAAVANGGLFVDFSTIGPGTIERIAARLADRGMRTVSVAVTRGTAAAEVGQLALYVGAEGDVPPELRPAFEAMASEVRTVGGLGAAKALKIANNIVLACVDIAICEAIVLAGRYGHTPKAVTDELAASGVRSWALENHIVKFVLPDDLGPGYFSTRHMLKDVELFLDLAREQGAPAVLGGVAAACYRGTIAAGLGEHYHPVVIRWLEAGAGSGRVTDGATGETPDHEALAAICDAVAAVQALVSLDALRAVCRTGIEATEAAGHLDSGSAANVSLAPIAAYLDGDATAFSAPAAGAALAGATALANVASVPSFMFELGRHAALAESRAAAG